MSKIQQIKDIADNFRKEILRASRAPQEEKPQITIHAVKKLIQALTIIQNSHENENFGRLQKVFRARLQSLRQYGPLWDHALSKPYGYPGDFEILNAIYRNTFVVKNTISIELDRAFLTSHLANVVRKRKEAVVSCLSDLLKKFHEKDNIKILDLGCGPCVDVAEFLIRNTTLLHHFSILCVDHDKKALDFAKTYIEDRIKDKNNIGISYVQANILLLKDFVSLKSRVIAPFDIVYSVGLVDYIPDRLLCKLLPRWWQIINPGGFLLLTIKDREKYNPVFYDWMADWKFISRTTKQFIALLINSLRIKDNNLRVESSGASVLTIIKK